VRVTLVVLLAIGVGGCSAVRSSGVATGVRADSYSGAMRVSATVEPPGVAQVAVVQASGVNVLIAEIVPELMARARRHGGDFVKIDDIRSSFEVQARSQMQTYGCGTPRAPRTCTRVVTTQEEVMTTTITGRAFATRHLVAVPPVAPPTGPMPAPAVVAPDGPAPAPIIDPTTEPAEALTSPPSEAPTP
jgi:hypothetical protein